MEQDLIVLKDTSLGGGAAIEFERVGARPLTKPGISLGVELRSIRDEKDRQAVRNESGFVADAPSMPIALVKQLTSTTITHEEPPKVSWGVNAVGVGAAEKFIGRGVTVAVLDTGIDLNHPAFRGVEIVSRNFTDEGPDDIDGHGTHCAGTIFGRDVDGCRIGVARGVTKAVIGKVLGAGGGSTGNIVKAIRWAQAEGAQIISMSLGIDFVDFQKTLMKRHGLPFEQATSMALAGYRDNVRIFDKISQAMSSGTALEGSALVVAAAGNESARPRYSITVAPPAAAELFVSVAAVGLTSAPQRKLDIAAFSNSGALFAAPGVEIWSARPGGGLVSKDGTSMAAPHVAGVAAMFAEKLTNGTAFRADDVFEAMKRDSLKLAPRIAASDARFGLVQAPRD